MTPTEYSSIPALSLTPVLDYLENKMPDYPFDAGLDRPFVEELYDDFGDLDLLEQIKRYRWFHDNRPPTDRPRLALRKWLAVTRRW